uniref:Uncharacterized protein n=1 Tax=Ditylenchus dipsaci TaxID=166011 RepID=A0A915CSR5_9BILA
MYYCSTTTIAACLPPAYTKPNAIYCGGKAKTKWSIMLALLLPLIFVVPAIDAASSRMGEDSGREEQALYKCYKSTFHPKKTRKSLA